jgi:ElaB/YqjD/DUF883 family membrane-anchored ribosome-binding protein
MRGETGGHARRGEEAMADTGVMEGKGHSGGEGESARRLREQAGVLRDDVRELGRLAREAGQEKLADAKAGVDALEDSLVRYVRDKPIKSLCIAIGAGALLGYLLSRR